MASTLGFDNWQSTAGTNYNTVVQVIQTNYQNVWSQSIANGTTWYDVTGFNATITPKYANSKILVTVNVILGTSYWEVGGRIIRSTDNQPIGLGNSNGLRERAGFSAIHYDYNSTSYYNTLNVTYRTTDTPNTTSPVTYKLQLNGYSTHTIYVNAPQYDSNDWDYFGSPVSQITLMEITQ